MKYIRTKDGRIIKITNTEYIDELPIRYSHCDIDFVELYNAIDVLREADTIEELCDEFVVKIKTGYLITYYDKKLLTQDANKNGADVYGAIWTDKGLKYVAKMNEKGELELL